MEESYQEDENGNFICEPGWRGETFLIKDPNLHLIANTRREESNGGVREVGSHLV